MVVDRFKKSKVADFAKETYETTIEYDIFCTRYGKPYTGDRTFKFESKNGVDGGGILNYKSK